MPLVWDPHLMTGFSQMDDQHCRIFRSLDQLQEAVEGGQGHDELGRVLSSVAVFVVAHFREEEKLMERFGYGGRAGHELSHAEVRDRVEGMVDAYHSGGLDPAGLLRFMEWWLKDHILHQDQPLADFLKAMVEAAG